MTITLIPARFNLAALGGVLCYLLCGHTNAFASTPRYHRSTSTTTTLSPTALQETSLSSLTDVTFTAPKFALDDNDDDDDDDRKYPSPLHSIHIKSVLTDSESAKCLQLATDYAVETGRWEQPDAARHASYATCDFPVQECDALDTYLQETGFDNRIWEHLSELYGVRYEDMSYLDFFCAHYEAKTDSDADVDSQQQQTTMDRLEAHRDGSLLSFTVTLTPPSEFQGGGTFFDALRDTNTDSILQAGGAIRPLRAGDAVLHGGKMLHGAAPVTSGQRTVLVGFIDVAEWCYRPGVLSAACRDWGRMDVAAYRWKRQQAKTSEMEGTGQNKSGWPLRNQKWLPPSKGRSHIQGFRPAFSSVELRGDGEYQRLKKLEAEDYLLRNILLPEDERDELIEGDITIL
jgi:predicted 2-oxoglutarate/Fe(II)-dependent dioxygenase YbiX